jgi:hypothetical protein
MRAHIETIYFGRIKGIVSDLRSIRQLAMIASGKMLLGK